MMVMTEAEIAATTAYAEEVEPELSTERPAASVDAPIDFILHRYHDTHRRELAELAPLALRVETKHCAHPDCPSGLAVLLGEISEELEAHM